MLPLPDVKFYDVFCAWRHVKNDATLDQNFKSLTGKGDNHIFSIKNLYEFNLFVLITRYTTKQQEWYWGILSRVLDVYGRLQACILGYPNSEHYSPISVQ